MEHFKLEHGGKKQLIQRWNGLLEAHRIDPDQHFSILDDLLTRYTEPHRAYHNLSHLANMFGALSSISEDQKVGRDGALDFAIWFHDAVYDPTRADNEAQSAGLAQESLERLGAEPALIQRVTQIILATQNHQANDPDTALFLDADLAILGAEPKTYRAYARAIRQEYAWVPEALFRERRAQVLQKFLSRERIYQTEAFAHLEPTARKNLRRELEALAQPTAEAHSANASQ